MSKNAVETVMGGVVIIVAAGFLAFAYKSANVGKVSKDEGYDITAKFQNVGGINLGSDVRVGGIKVGSVTKSELDPNTYNAILTFTLKKEIKIPTDSTAAISSDGLLGSKYISLSPGGEDKMLENGGRVMFTQSSVSIEELIGKFVFSSGGVDKGSDGGEKKEEAKVEENHTPSLATP